MKSSSRTRRNMLYSLTAMAVSAAGRRALALTPAISSQGGAPAETSSHIRLGVQTNAWPIDPSKFDTFLVALREAHETGYSGFETGFANLRSQSKSLSSARSAISSTGLTFLGVHIFLPEYDTETNIAPKQLYEQVAQSGATLGAQRLIFSGSPAVNEEEIHRKTDALNRAGEFARTLGLKVAYHNHWPEFKYNGREIEALYAATDPSLVSFLLDAGHAYRAGCNLLEFVQRHHTRLTAIHFRDYRDHVQVPLGQGTLPLKEVAAALRQANWTGWAMNEEEREDGSKQGQAVIHPAFQALKGAFPV
jgi:inosose dehydratase